jgi:ATP-binding cassette, subfamily B, bacterial PglK
MPSKKTFKNILQLYNYLSLKKKIKLYLLFFLFIVNSIFELISLGAVVPFLGVIINPEIIYANPIINDISRYYGLQIASDLVLPITVIFALLTIISAILRIIVLRINTSFAFSAGHEISCLIYKKILQQPYEYHLINSNSKSISTIINRSDQAMFWVMLPALNIISYSVIFIFLLFGLFFIDIYISIIATSSLAISYAIFIFFSRIKLNINSRTVNTNVSNILSTLQDSLNGIRYIILGNLQNKQLEKYKQFDLPLREAYASNLFIAGFPKFIMESIGILVIIFIAYFSIQFSSNPSTVLPKLGALALAAQRMLPALQQIYGGLVSIKGSSNALEEIISCLLLRDKSITMKSIRRIKFENSIKLNSAFFRFTDKEENTLQDVNLVINKGSRVAIIGETGAGKTTLVDILMGLLPLHKGQLLVDDTPLKTNSQIKSWQSRISHVPQDFYLSDSTIAENIAYGIPLNEIDMNKVKFVANQASMTNFIAKKKNGFLSNVGDKGSRLSGGEKQRIIIARALYKDADLLIFDEGTSALDNKTEEAVMNTIRKLSLDLTIIIIAHRLSTIKYCDKVFEVNNRKIKIKNDQKLIKP